MPGKLRSIVRTPRFERELTQIFADPIRADAAIEGLEWTLSRMAEFGMAVPGIEGVSSWPLHTDGPSFLVIYEIREDEVVCIATRRIASATFGDR